jgi:hypothetical protein
LLSIRILSLANLTVFQVILLRTLLYLCPGPMLFPMVGPWNGIGPRPTQVPPSDVELGLSSMSVPRRLILSYFTFRCRYSPFKMVLYKFLLVRSYYYIYLKLMWYYACDVKLSVLVSLDSPSCGVPCFDPELGGFIGTLPDRPRGYTI